MKLLHSPFKYKKTCFSCGSEFVFDDFDITMSDGLIKYFFFDLNENIKKSILKNVYDDKNVFDDTHELAEYLDASDQVYVRYILLYFNVICPFCKEINSVLSKDGRHFAKVYEYCLYNKTKFIFKLEDLSGKASYILHKMGVLPHDLK